ncbi:hypothetical protein KR054_006719, partial [Drosophila jambulina]
IYFINVCLFIQMFPTSMYRPVDVRLISFNASSPDICDFTNFRMIGRDRRLNGTVHLKTDIDNESYTVTVKSYNDVNGDGNYKLLPFGTSDLHSCDAVRNYWHYANHTLKYGVNTNFPGMFKPCPIPKGLYYYKDIVLNTDPVPPTVPRGFIKGVIILYKNKEVVDTFEAVVQIKDRLF